VVFRGGVAVGGDGAIYLFFTLVQTGPDGMPCSVTAWSRSLDLLTWTPPRAITPRDPARNYSSPGNIVRAGGEWVLCLQTYPRPHGEKYGNQDARVFVMRSPDLVTWSEPELLRVKGPDVPVAAMGRMIDPYLLQDKDDPGLWWCFYKQNGASFSWSRDLRSWTYAGRVDAGENVCVFVDGGEYVMYHSPRDGIGVKRSADLWHWLDTELLRLGQPDWPWARGRLTAGCVLDLRCEPRIGHALLFFHGSDYPEDDPRGGFDTFASIGLAWSRDLRQWRWPGEAGTAAPDRGSA